MNLTNLTSENLRRAASIQEQIAALNKELSSMLGASPNNGVVSKNHRTMSASARRKIAAAQKARWAKLRLGKGAARSTKPAAKKKTMSPATRAKLSAKLKRYWAMRKAGKKI